MRLFGADSPLAIQTRDAENSTGTSKRQGLSCLDLPAKHLALDLIERVNMLLELRHLHVDLLEIPRA